MPTGRETEATFTQQQRVGDGTGVTRIYCIVLEFVHLHNLLEACVVVAPSFCCYVLPLPLCRHRFLCTALIIFLQVVKLCPESLQPSHIAAFRHLCRGYDLPVVVLCFWRQLLPGAAQAWYRIKILAANSWPLKLLRLLLGISYDEKVAVARELLCACNCCFGFGCFPSVSVFPRLGVLSV